MANLLENHQHRRLIEEALIEYVELYGLSQKARSALSGVYLQTDITIGCGAVDKQEMVPDPEE